MVTRTRALRNPASVFTLLALMIVAIEMAIVHSQRFASNADVASWAVTFDLTITIPALYYWFVVRAGRARVLSIAPVFVVCALVAAVIVPRDHQQFLHQLRFAMAPLDLISIYLVVRALRKGSRPDGIVASFVMTELAILRYAIAGWREQRVVPSDATAVTVHERSGWGSIAACFVVLITFESIGAHLLVSIWSAKAAWILTSLDLYGILWILGDYHALRLRPTLVTRDAIEIRHGLRWSVTIARDNIASIDRIGGEPDWKRRATLRVALMDDPRFLIRLREPVVAHGLAGMKRTIDSIAILPDDEASFHAAFAS